MSLLAKKLLEAANKSDGFDAWALAPIAAEYIQELEAQRDEMLEALAALVLDESQEYIPTRLWDAARAAIAKAKGIMLTSSPPQDDWLFLAMKHFQSVIAKAKGE